MDGIPMVLVRPDGEIEGDVVLWMTHLGGSAVQTLPMLERFAAAGHPAASFDPVLHGSRGSGDPWGFAADVLTAFRRRMWPILGQSTLEAMRVLSWAKEETGRPGSALAGGVSMGGDVAIALAGVDARVGRVATIGSTPNWCRPDMRDVRDASKIIDQGDADPRSQWYADQLDPSRHLERYVDGAAIALELGEADRHVPAANAQAFHEALVETAPAAAARLRIQIHPGLDHCGVTTSEASLDAASEWLLSRTSV